MMLISHMQHFSRCLNRMNLDQLPSSSKPSTVPMVSQRCTRSPMDVRRSITPRSCGKTTGKFHTDSTDFMRAAGLAGLPLPSCNRYQRRSWPFKSSNHPTDCFHRASNVSMKFKGRKVPKISADFPHLTNQGFGDAVAATCHNLISPYGDGAQTSKGFEPPETIHWCPEIYPRHPMAASTKPTQTKSSTHATTSSIGAIQSWLGFTTTGSSARTLRRKCISWR